MEQIKFEKVKRVSIEKEFALLDKNKMPISRLATNNFMRKLEAMKDKVENLSELDTETAVNAVEMKFSLLQPKMVSSTLLSARKAVNELAEAEGLMVRWANQDQYFTDEYNGCFITYTFPELINGFIFTNSTHLHFEIAKEDVIHAYNQMNCLVPWFMVHSRENIGYDLYEATRKRVAFMEELYLPQRFGSDEDYQRFVFNGSRFIENRLKKTGGWQNISNCESFDKSKLCLLPKGIYHQARIRKDLELPNGNISLELRAIAGQEDPMKDIILIEAAICAFEEALKRKEEINRLDKVRSFYQTFDSSNGSYTPARDFIHYAYLKNMGRPISIGN
ncbi:MAG: hypothetical protein NTY68_04815 [Candidatus Micrarchaeota archaeon]|nr:hypothetical protein [Candidatus Micrarchaeota archaeon]